MWGIVLQHHLSFLILLATTIILVSGVQFVFQLDGDFVLQSDSNSIPPSWSNNRLWLTPDPDTTKTELQLATVGRVVYNHTLPLFNQSSGQVVSFNTSFSFAIVTAGCAYGDCGDGMAFSISPLLHLPPNSSGGNLGLTTVNYVSDFASLPDRHLFAVEFDTYQNRQFSDPSASHIGINFNGLTSNYTLDTSDPAHSDLYLYNNSTISTWVEYIAPLHQILVFAAAKSSERPSKPSITYTYDLSLLFDRNQPLYAAISAASGLFFEGTALFSWDFTSEDVTTPTRPPPTLESPAPPPPSLKSAPLPSPSPPPSHRTLDVLPLTLSLSGVLLLAAACAFLYTRRKHIFNQRLPAMIEMIPSSGSLPRHTYRELKKATQGFSDKQKVGEGGFSSVYKGTLSTGDVVAVKRLKEGLRMEVEFASEIQIISHIRHRNLLQLKGWGYERGEALLVYQYMPHGSLDSYLFGKKRGDPEMQDGEKRYSILVGVAAALEYLHEGLGECVLHRDVKAANVMLTESFEAMLGDFGLARLITHNQVVTMTAAGTPGYVAPEVVYTGKATDKADVYSFGMLALEVACGRRAVDESLPPEEVRLVDWVWLLQQGGKIMDAACCRQLPHYQHMIQAKVANCTDHNTGHFVEEPLIAHKPKDHIAKDWCSLQELKWQCVLHVALLCCNPWPEDRPSMRQVHQSLRESLVLPLPSTRPTYGRPASSSININTSSSSALNTCSSSAQSSTPPSSQNLFSL